MAETRDFILNVNDDPASRYVVTRMLEREGFAVREAGTGYEALWIAREHPRLIILDIRLPDIDGLEVCRRLKNDLRTANIPVLQTSATFVSAERKALGLESGADGYLVQPVEPLELQATVRALLRANAAERAVRDTANDWQRTFDALMEAVVVIDASGVVTRANAAMREAFGCHDPVGRSVVRLLADVLDGATPDLLDAARRTGARQQAEVHARGRWIHATLDPTPAGDGGGTPDRFVLVLSDVTARRALEDQERRRAEELAEANARKDQFLAMLAHELRNPPNAIATANALSARMGPADAPHAHARDVIARQTGHLARLVDDLLEVSRLTLGKIQLQCAEINLLESLRHAIQITGPFLEARRVRLVEDLPHGLSFPMMADPLRIEQVFINVLNNAAKFSAPGSEVVISCGTGDDTGSLAVVRVRDHGVGIPPEHLESVFDLFVQVDGSLARSLGGLGIGLTVARNLVEKHGGSIRARSDGVGHGTEIEVRLPLCAPFGARTPQAAAGSAGPPCEALSVLVIEDSPDAADLLRRLLESRNHSVHVANDGLSGLDAALSICPDVALVDIGLPGLDGYQIAASLRANDAARETYLVAITGYGRPEDRARALEAGFDQFIVKPVDFDELDRMLATRPISK